MKRIILGSRGSDVALWISKPGKDASSTNDDDMMVSPSRFLVQPYMQGRLYSDGSSRANIIVTHNLGFIPVIEVFPAIMQNSEAKVSTSTLDFTQNQNSDPTITYSKTDNSYTLKSGQTGYFSIDVTYVIFRTMLATS